MACYSPLTGWRARDGSGFTSQASLGYIDQPVTVSCGACIGCRLERSRQWSVRCTHEATQHKSNSFLTLTIDPEHMPCDRSIDTKTWQRFAKRLRHTHGPFRYYHCGEYGAPIADPDDPGYPGLRPHYHALIFGLDFKADRTHYQTTARGDEYFKSASLNTTWGQGDCIIGEITPQSASYVARYTLGKHYGPLSTYTYGERVDTSTGEVDYYRQPPYSTMSRRPGLGQGWIDKFTTDVFPSDEVIIDGQQARVPSYYDLQLPDEELVAIKSSRRKNARRHKANNTPDRLAVREQVKLSQISTLKRNL